MGPWAGLNSQWIGEKKKRFARLLRDVWDVTNGVESKAAAKLWRFPGHVDVFFHCDFSPARGA